MFGQDLGVISQVYTKQKKSGVYVSTINKFILGQYCTLNVGNNFSVQTWELELGGCCGLTLEWECRVKVWMVIMW